MTFLNLKELAIWLMNEGVEFRYYPETVETDEYIHVSGQTVKLDRESGIFCVTIFSEIFGKMVTEYFKTDDKNDMEIMTDVLKDIGTPSAPMNGSYL